MTEAVTIPQQLITAGARFILVAPKEKRAIEQEWQLNNYDSQSPRLIEHLAAGGNYGVLSRNGICCIDIDDPAKFKELGTELPHSFSVQRGRGKTAHYYFRCPDCPDTMKTKHECSWGDIRLGGNFYTVGANCIAPTRDNPPVLLPYEIFRDVPIFDVPWALIEGILKASGKDTSEITLTDKKKPFEIPPLVKQRHPTITSSVGVMVRAGFTYDAVESAIIEENKHFEVPKPLDVLKRETLKAWQYCAKKQILKETDKERVDQTGTGDRKRPDYIYQQRGWFERDGGLYLEVIDTSSEIPVYSYAACKQDGIFFTDGITVKEPLTDSGKVIVPGLKYVPRDLPVNKDGQVIHLVGLPDRKELEQITATDAHEIKEAIYQHVNRYCDLASNDVDLCVYYIFMTWFYPKLSTLPYLRFRADTGKGKSRILKVISELCFMPVKAGGASTASGTIRIQEYWHGTLVIDEADIKGESDSEGYQNDMIKFLNLGFEQGQYFVKSDKMDPKNQEIFDPFSPKIIAMRGVFHDPATEGRCLSISPSETERKDIPAILPAEYNLEVGKIRATMTHYALTNWGCITDADPYPSFNDVECEPRLKQLGSPLARVLSKIFPDGLTEFEHYIERRQIEVKLDRAGSFVGSVVNSAYDLAVDPDNIHSVVTVRDVSDTMGSTPQKISRVLKDAGMAVEARKVRKTICLPNQPPTTRPVTMKIVVVKNSRAWREVCRRYITTRSEQQSQIGCDNDLVDCPAALRSQEFVSN